jgi:hypothetical protein
MDDLEKWAKWMHADVYGWTTAHSAVFSGSLPADFDQWTLATNKGWSVAHEAVKYDYLPDSFDQWSIADKKGWTVLDYLLEQRLQGAQQGLYMKFMAKWENERPLCRTNADWLLFKAKLPEIHRKYSIQECMDIGGIDDGQCL